MLNNVDMCLYVICEGLQILYIYIYIYIYIYSYIYIYVYNLEYNILGQSEKIGRSD